MPGGCQSKTTTCSLGLPERVCLDRREVGHDLSRCCLLYARRPICKVGSLWMASRSPSALSVLRCMRRKHACPCKSWGVAIAFRSMHALHLLAGELARGRGWVYHRNQSCPAKELCNAWTCFKVSTRTVRPRPFCASWRILQEHKAQISAHLCSTGALFGYLHPGHCSQQPRTNDWAR